MVAASYLVTGNLSRLGNAPNTTSPGSEMFTFQRTRFFSLLCCLTTVVAVPCGPKPTSNRG